MSTRSPGHARPASEAPTGVRGLEALAEAVDALPLGVAVYDAADESFRVLYLNRCARELARPGAEAGTTFSESFPDAAPNGIAELMEQARRTGEHRHLSGVPTATGRAWDIDLHPVVDGSGRVRLLVMAGQEVTGQLETQRRLEAMLASTAALWRPMSVPDVARQAAEQAAALVPALDCAVALVPPGSPSTLVIEAVTADWMRPFQGTQVPFEGPTSGPVLGEHRAVELGPAEVQEPFGALMLANGAAAVRVIPLTTGEDLPDGRGALGLLILTASRPGGLEPAERALADELAKRVSLALHRAELLAQANEGAERLRFGLQLALTLAASLDAGAIMRHLLEQAARAVEAERATLLQVEEDGVRIAAALDLEGEAAEPGTLLPLLPAEFQRLLRERRPYVGAHDSSPWPEEIKELHRGIRQTLAVPLVLADEVVGALSVSRRSSRSFTARDTAVMEQIGTIAVLALRNARLFEAAEAERRRADQSIRRLRTGVEVADDLGRRLDRAEVVRRLLVHAVTAVGAERASLARVEGGEVVVEGSYAEAGGAPRPGTRFTVREVPLYERAIKGRVPVQSSRRLRRRRVAPGEPGLERLVAVPLLDQERVVAALGVGRTRAEPFGEEDVATLQQIGNIAALALRNASLFAEAEEAGRTKSDFMNMAAHELRTPLTVLGGYVSMLRDGTFGTPPRRWRDPIEIISAKAAELTDLVDELLMAARIESGAIAPPSGRTDLVAALEDALRRARPRAAMLEASLSSEVPQEEVWVSAEPEHVARIIDNLVNNALTYSREKPWLRVTLTAVQDEAVMSFRDHGRGVPVEMREHIFDQFVRVEDEGPYHPGTGLGLYISRALTERSGGRLRLTEGGPGEGSVFVLRVPRLPG